MAERLGFYSVWGADFMAPSPSMGITGTQPPSFYEILISLAYVSATTKRIKLGAGTVPCPSETRWYWQNKRRRSMFSAVAGCCSGWDLALTGTSSRR